MQDVFSYIEQNRETYIGWLQDICKQPSVAAQNRGMKETADMVERFVREIGGEAEQLETSGYPVVFGQFKGESERILSFYNHYDVQPEDPLDLWHSPPFGAEIRDGYMYARGVADNKGNLMARLAAVHACLQVRGKLPVGVKFIVEGEEEIGSVHLEEFVEKYADRIGADGCVWEFGYKNADGRPQISLGVKGMCYVELICRGANTDLHSANAAIIENPAWHLLWALNTLKGPDERIRIEGFYDKVASLSDDDQLMLEQMIYNEEDTLEKLGLKSFLLDLKGIPLKEKLIFQPTCTVCGIVSGYIGQGSKTVLPAEARVKLDFRLVPDQDPHEILALLRKHLDEHGFSDIEIQSFTLEHPARTPLNNPLTRAVVNTSKQIYGMEPTIMPMSPGTGPMYILCQHLGIPAVSVGVGHFASNNHAPNENISIDDYIQGIKHIAAILEEFAKEV
ncbi:M20/M25/M40 family metallo-hydrolase [Brevibacillus borstelensis]|uniref:M20 family metallopeptidase n=1 Tax=Brevibacillus borstelensis TaxID=45462 RepID=UPI000F08AECE|nr:M20/M25/M40 family metallo-hydrolase [Brevibacillus borstelensis]MED1883504.1 M20/M25/M40 family metallo-hydrolase [Brevibacillus borstelensis]RNB61912.1 M20/M25/M40 family metallo-hydrolase [Brevibacillus borstelensis]GED51426.1 peptidase M20 [Brevibacillus borstelensis]